MSARFVATTGINAAARGVAPLASSIQILGSSGTAVSHTGDTNEAQLASITVPGNSMGANGKLRITVWFSYTNSANNKTLRVRFSGSGGTAYVGTVQTTTSAFQTQITIANNNATNSQKMINQTFPYNTTTSAPSTSSVDTTVATTVYISGALASSGETITLESYTVELIPGV